ncbi:hypothetical protein MRX96_038964 [Rhipicephalus microplus]
MASNSAAYFDPVAAEIAIVRALDELCVRRSNVAVHRTRIDELRRDIAHLRECIDVEKHRLRVTEWQMSERHSVLRQEAEQRRRPMLAEKDGLTQHIGRVKCNLSAAVGRARSLETEKLTLEGKVKDLRDQKGHLEEVLRERSAQLHDLTMACRPVLDEFGKLVALLDAVQASLFDVLRRRVALERERRECVKRESRLASECASLKKALESATSSTDEVQQAGAQAGHTGPAPDRWYKSLMEKLESDAAACQRDLESLKRAVGCGTATDVALQTALDVPDASAL